MKKFKDSIFLTKTINLIKVDTNLPKEGNVKFRIRKPKYKDDPLGYLPEHRMTAHMGKLVKGTKLKPGYYWIELEV